MARTVTGIDSDWRNSHVKISRLGLVVESTDRSRQVKIVTSRLLRPVGGMALGVHRLRLNEKGERLLVYDK